MNRPRLGKGDSIFAATEKTSPAAKPVAEPSQTSYPSVENKTTVILQPELVVYLDRLGGDIREKTGWKVRRTEIMRALVIGLKQSGVDLTSCRDEAELATFIGKRLAG